MPPRNRRKKRRTEDFSLDSDSSSEDESPKTTVNENQPQLATADAESDAIDVNVDIDVTMADEPKAKQETNPKLMNLKEIPLTQTSLNLANSTTPFGNNDAAVAQIATDRAELTQQYLKMFASQYSNDIDELRQKPDFSEKLLVMLAKALQLGANMFDDSTLAALMEQ